MGADQSIIVDVGVVNHYPTGGVDAVIAYNGDNAIRAVGYSEITDVVNDGKVNWLTCACDDSCDVKNCDLAIHEDTFANDFVWANEVEDGQYVHIFDEDEIVVSDNASVQQITFDVINGSIYHRALDFDMNYPELSTLDGKRTFAVPRNVHETYSCHVLNTNHCVFQVVDPIEYFRESEKIMPKDGDCIMLSSYVDDADIIKIETTLYEGGCPWSPNN